MSGFNYINVGGLVPRKQTASEFYIRADSNFTIAAATGYEDGDVLTFMIQDSAGGGGVLTWSGNYRFDSASPPAFSTVGTKLVIRFIFSSTHNEFFEISRSENIA